MELGQRLRLVSLIHEPSSMLRTFGASWQCGSVAVWRGGRCSIEILWEGGGGGGEDEDDAWHAGMGLELPSGFLVDFGARTLHHPCHISFSGPRLARYSSRCRLRGKLPNFDDAKSTEI